MGGCPAVEDGDRYESSLLGRVQLLEVAEGWRSLLRHADLRRRPGIGSIAAALHVKEACLVHSHTPAHSPTTRLPYSCTLQGWGGLHDLH